jgi:hypothetical protein
MAGKQWSRGEALPAKAIDINFWANRITTMNVNAVPHFLGTVREDA